LPFARAAFELRKRHPALRPERLRHGAPLGEGRGPDLSWLGPSGLPLSEAEWHDPESRVLGMLLREELEANPTGRCHAVLCLFNAGSHDVRWTLPELEVPGRWRLRLDAASARPLAKLVGERSVSVLAHSAMALEHEVSP
jgi:glycogen operon protein